MTLIELSHVTKTYRMGDEVLNALDDFSLKIAEGEFVSIVGPSGCGKSTLMNILGLLDQPTSGSYLLDGRPIEKLSDDERSEKRNQKIGFVFQSFHLLPRATAVRNVEMPLVYSNRFKRATPAEIRQMAIEALERVDLANRKDHRPNELSGGQRQRVAIARALVNQPRLILADEPTGNLDSKSGLQIMELFHELHRQGATLILVTHDPKLAEEAERVITLSDGKVVSDRHANA